MQFGEEEHQILELDRAGAADIGAVAASIGVGTGHTRAVEAGMGSVGYSL